MKCKKCKKTKQEYGRKGLCDKCYMKEYYLKNKDKWREYSKKYREKDREGYNQYHIEYRNRPENVERYKEIWKKNAKKYNERHPEKVKAHSIANYHIKIPKNQICEVCKKRKAIQKHHPNHLKPLKVKFVCLSCHRELDKRGDN